jgi:hypothetical protein
MYDRKDPIDRLPFKLEMILNKYTIPEFPKPYKSSVFCSPFLSVESSRSYNCVPCSRLGRLLEARRAGRTFFDPSFWPSRP